MRDNALFDLSSHLQLIQLEGDQVAVFLQGQLTCDVRDIAPTQTRYAAHCSPKGRVLSFFRVLQYQNHFYLLVPIRMVDLVITQLQKYAVFSKINLKLNTTLKILGFMGQSLVHDWEQSFGEIPKQPDEAISAEKENLLIIRAKGTAPRFEVIGTKTVIDEWLALLPQSYSEPEKNQWILSDIDANLAMIYPETTNLFTPHMLGYIAINAVNFKKGCYTGQEIIARTQYLGKAKKQLQSLYLTQTVPPKIGDTVFNETHQAIGTMIEIALEKKEEYKILAVLEAVSQTFS